MNLIAGAKETLDTSRYVYVDIKRAERAGIEDLEKAFEDISSEYQIL